MPNLPCVVQKSASGYSPNAAATSHDIDFVQQLMSSVGSTRHVDVRASVHAMISTIILLQESKLDAVTGLSGSGPAYAFIAIEALADGGVRMGLPRDVALKLAAQTMLGSSGMLCRM